MSEFKFNKDFFNLTKQEQQDIIMFATVAAGGMGALIISKKMKENNILLRWLDRTDIDGWSFAHFTLHAALGYTFYPKFWVSSIWGFSWEQAEQYIGRSDPKYEYWIDDSQFDYVINHLGMITGMLIRKYLPRN